jgi:hypothetical protein
MKEECPGLDPVLKSIAYLAANIARLTNLIDFLAQIRAAFESADANCSTSSV